MPRTEIALRRGRGPEEKNTLMREIYAAMRESVDVPEDDLFISLTEHEEDEFLYGRRYLGVERTDALVMIRVTLSEGRKPAQKQALYQAICRRLQAAVGLRPEDVFICLVETKWENWSFGLGRAQYAEA